MKAVVIIFLTCFTIMSEAATPATAQTWTYEGSRAYIPNELNSKGVFVELICQSEGRQW